MEQTEMTNRMELLALEITRLAEYYNKELSESVLSMYIEDLIEFQIEEVRYAIKQYRQESTATFFPMACILRNIIRPVITEADEGREVAVRIVGAISKFGYINPDRAKEFVGGLGWLVVSRMGGWENVCKTVTEDSVGIFQAQFRELAISLAKRAKAGILDQAPQIPQAVETKRLGQSMAGLLAGFLPNMKKGS